MEKKELNKNENRNTQNTEYTQIINEYLNLKNTILSDLDIFIINISSSILTQKRIEINSWEHSDLDLSILNFLIKFNKSFYKIEKVADSVTGSVTVNKSVAVRKKLIFIPGELKIQIGNKNRTNVYNNKTSENNRRIIRLNKSSNDVCSIAKVLFLIGPFFDKPIDIRIENCCTNNIESVDLFKTTNWLILKLFNLKNFDVNIIKRGFKSIHSKGNLINKRSSKGGLFCEEENLKESKKESEKESVKKPEKESEKEPEKESKIENIYLEGEKEKKDLDGEKERILNLSDDGDVRRVKFHKKVEENIIGGIVEIKIEKLMKISSPNLLLKDEKFIKIRGLTISNQIRTDTVELLSKTILSIMKPVCKNTKVFKIISNDKSFNLFTGNNYKNRNYNYNNNNLLNGEIKSESHELYPGYECSVYAESKKGIVYSTINYNNLISNFPSMKWCKESEIAEFACTEMVNEMGNCVNFDRRLIYFILFYYSLSDGMSSISVKILTKEILNLLEILKKQFKITYFTKNGDGIATIYIKGVEYENVNKK